MSTFLLVGVGGFIGSIGRYLITGWAQMILGTAFPWGTAIVNITGCFLVGFIMTIGLELTAMSTEVRTFVVTGILGGLTTFSSFGYESARPLLEGNIWIGIANIALNLVVGLLAVATGVLVARFIKV